jgi:uncharacterized protein YbaP (TraB family)
VFAAILGLALACAAPQVRADPALWEVKSRTATVYLFGTVHLLRRDVQWQTPKVAEAFGKSDELWLEVADPADANAVLPLVTKYGFDAKAPLSTKLSKADRDRLAADAKALGEPETDFEPMRPWLASIRLSVAPLVKAGFDPDAGVDRLLKEKADLAGRPVKAFETLEQQIRYFADLPEPLQVAELHVTLDEFNDATTELDKLEKAWAAGDTSAIYKALDEDMKRTDPKLYKVLLIDRNRAFADGIVKRLKGRGTAFVAVGAGHLAGPDGIQALLARRGIKVRRL